MIADDMPWYAVRVKPRCEFIVAVHLHDRGYESFVPAYRARRQWSDRMKEIEQPLFPGYLLCRCKLSTIHGVLHVPGVLHVVSAGKQPLPVDENEVASIQALCHSGLPAAPCPFLSVGRRVLIKRGPLARLSGIVLELRNEWRIVVSISLLQRSVSAEIQREWIDASEMALCTASE